MNTVVLEAVHVQLDQLDSQLAACQPRDPEHSAKNLCLTNYEQ